MIFREFTKLRYLLVGFLCMFFLTVRPEKLPYNLVEGLPDIYITPLSERIGHTWSEGSVWDKELIKKFYTLLANHGGSFVVLDLGAQTGSFSLLAKYFPQSSWYAFEPIEEAANTLKDNLLLNNIQNVAVHQAAVTDFSGFITLAMPPMDSWGLATVGSNPLRFTPAMERKVRCIDLDNFVAQQGIRRVDFMKLDTEGSELSILRGARKLLMRDHPIIVMEYNQTNMQQCGACKEELDDFLTELGYTWKLISSEDILCVPTIKQ